MTRAISVHLPEIPWLCLVREEAGERLPALLSLIEGGCSGVLPAVGPSPMADGVITTGCRPGESGLLVRQGKRPDGYGVDLANSMTLQEPSLWDYLDAAGFRSAIINMRATNYGHLQHGTIVSDLFCEIRARTFKEWGVPPGSVQPLELAEKLAGLRLHPEELTQEHLSPFFARGSDRAGGEEDARLIARILCENTTAHSVATYILEHQDADYLAIRYPALEQLRPHFSPPDTDQPGRGVMWMFLELLDAFVARLMELASDDTVFFVTGGTEHQPYWVAHGPGIEQDVLLPHGTQLYDVFVTVLGLYGIQAPEKTAGVVPGTVFDPVKFSTGTILPKINPGFTPLLSADAIIQSMKQDGAEAEPASEAHDEMERDLRFRQYFMMGENARYEGRMKEAVSAFQNALEIIPDDSIAIHRLCSCLLYLSRVNEARSCFSAIPEASCKNHLIQILDADIAIAENRIDHAATCADKLSRIDVGKNKDAVLISDLHRRISEQYKKRGQHKEAFQHYCIARKLSR
jgi:hypothetical protein